MMLWIAQIDLHLPADTPWWVAALVAALGIILRFFIFPAITKRMEALEHRHQEEMARIESQQVTTHELIAPLSKQGDALTVVVGEMSRLASSQVEIARAVSANANALVSNTEKIGELAEAVEIQGEMLKRSLEQWASDRFANEHERQKILDTLEALRVTVDEAHRIDPKPTTELSEGES